MATLKLFASIQILIITLLTKDLYAAGDISNGMQEIKMRYYGKSKAITSYPLAQSKKLLNHIDVKKPFVLYIHGYQEHYSNESVQTVVSAYLKRGKDNIIVVDWNTLATGTYATVIGRSHTVAKYIAQALQQLVAAGLKTNKLHVIGHSLGGQVAGFIGSNLSFKIPRVTGLDPAYPSFYTSGVTHINANSGSQVDIIHTDGGQYGALVSTGTVDFFPNGGIKLQPGCPSGSGTALSATTLCSHRRSWRYYAESVNKNAAFPAIKCCSYQQFKNGACAKNQVINMGYAMPKGLSGNFYLTTNSQSPFGKGISGIGK